MTQHTPEPWAESNCPEACPHTIIPVDAYGSTRSDGPICNVKSDANRARIVACVNACQSFIDPAECIAALRAECRQWRDKPRYGGGFIVTPATHRTNAALGAEP